MIAADRSALAAQVVSGALEIRKSELTLTGNQLSSVATQAALVAGFSFTALTTADIAVGRYETDAAPAMVVLEYFVFFFSGVSFVSAVYCVIQATLVTVVGPQHALEGECAEAVIEAVHGMRREKAAVYSSGATSVAAFAVSLVLIVWAQQSPGIGLLVTLVTLWATYKLIQRSRHVLASFGIARLDALWENKDGEGRPGGDGAAIAGAGMVAVGGGVDGRGGARGAGGGAGGGGPADKTIVSDIGLASVATGAAGHAAAGGTAAAVISDVMPAADDAERKPVRMEGEIWCRLLQSESVLHKRYITLNKGLLDIYPSKAAYLQHEDALISNPLRMAEFQLVREHLEMADPTFTNMMRKAIAGDTSVSIRSRLFAAETPAPQPDLQFFLEPKQRDEFAVKTPVMFHVADREDLSRWLVLLSAATDGIQKLTHSQYMDIRGVLASNAFAESMHPLPGGSATPAPADRKHESSLGPARPSPLPTPTTSPSLPTTPTPLSRSTSWFAKRSRK